MKPFWIVWSPDGATPPRARHDSERAAIAEAERLARLNPGKEFFALAAVAVSQKVEVTTRRIGVGDDYRDIPF